MSFNVHRNSVVEGRPSKNQKEENKVRVTDVDFILDLETLIEETAADADLIAVKRCTEDNKHQRIAKNCKQGKKLTHHFVDNPSWWQDYRSWKLDTRH